MSAFDVKLPLLEGDQTWENADFDPGSVWGPGNNGKDLWGWTGGAYLSISDPKQEEDGTWEVRVTIREPDPTPGEQLALNARYLLADGKTRGVLSAYLT